MSTCGSKFARDLDWNLLKTFRQIVQAGGISRAATEHYRKQPTVSLALRRFEERAGARLCQRGPRGFRLTDEGEAVAEICNQIERLVSEIPLHLDESSGEVKGRVRLQTISNIVDVTLDQAISELHHKYPQIEFDIDVGTWETVPRALLNNHVDVGIAPARFRNAELSYELLFREVHRPYCGRSHPLFGSTVDPQALADEAFVLTGGDEPDELTRFRLRYGIGKRVTGMSEHLEEAKRLAILGVGMCFLPEAYAAPDVAAGRLWPATPSTVRPAMDMFVITRPGLPQSLAVRRFLEELRRRLPAATSDALIREIA